MSKDKELRHKAKKGLTDKELIEKYGKEEPVIPIDLMMRTMLSTPNPNAPVKVSKQP